MRIPLDSERRESVVASGSVCSTKILPFSFSFRGMWLFNYYFPSVLFDYIGWEGNSLKMKRVILDLGMNES